MRPLESVADFIPWALSAAATGLVLIQGISKKGAKEASLQKDMEAMKAQMEREARENEDRIRELRETIKEDRSMTAKDRQDIAELKTNMRLVNHSLNNMQQAITALATDIKDIPGRIIGQIRDLLQQNRNHP